MTARPISFIDLGEQYRRLAPAIACRLTFEVGALVLVYARLV